MINLLCTAGCEIYGFIGGLFGFISIATLAFVAYDRYVVISNPLEAAQKVTKKRALLMIMITWIFSLFWSLPPFFGWGAYVPEGFQVKFSLSKLFTLLKRIFLQRVLSMHKGVVVTQVTVKRAFMINAHPICVKYCRIVAIEKVPTLEFFYGSQSCSFLGIITIFRKLVLEQTPENKTHEKGSVSATIRMWSVLLRSYLKHSCF